MKNSEPHFVKGYKPGNEARVELKNGRSVDVVNGRYFDADTSIALHHGKIASIESGPGLAGAPTDVTPDFSIDLQGKTVLPGLFNAHCHAQMGAATLVMGLRDMSCMRKYSEQQVAKNMAECLAHGITNIRDAFVHDLRDNRARRERISIGETPGPRILQAVVVGPTGSYLQEKQGLLFKLMGAPAVDPSKDYAGAVAFPKNATEKQVRDAVDKAIDERGAEVIKIGDQSPSIETGKSIPIQGQDLYLCGYCK